MGAYSTLNITRSKALAVWRTHITNDPTDDELETFMDTVLAERLYNCRIVADGDEYNNDDEL